MPIRRTCGAKPLGNLTCKALARPLARNPAGCRALVEQALAARPDAPRLLKRAARRELGRETGEGRAAQVEVASVSDGREDVRKAVLIQVVIRKPTVKTNRANPIAVIERQTESHSEDAFHIAGPDSHHDAQRVSVAAVKRQRPGREPLPHAARRWLQTRRQRNIVPGPSKANNDVPVEPMVDGKRQDDLVEEPQLVCLGLCHGLPLKDAIVDASILHRGNRTRFVACLLLRETMM